MEGDPLKDIRANAKAKGATGAIIRRPGSESSPSEASTDSEVRGHANKEGDEARQESAVGGSAAAQSPAPRSRHTSMGMAGPGDRTTVMGRTNPLTKSQKISDEEHMDTAKTKALAGVITKSFKGFTGGKDGASSWKKVTALAGVKSHKLQEMRTPMKSRKSEISLTPQASLASLASLRSGFGTQNSSVRDMKVDSRASAFAVDQRISGSVTQGNVPSSVKNRASSIDPRFSFDRASTNSPGMLSTGGGASVPAAKRRATTREGEAVLGHAVLGHSPDAITFARPKRKSVVTSENTVLSELEYTGQAVALQNRILGRRSQLGGLKLDSGTFFAENDRNSPKNDRAKLEALTIEADFEDGDFAIMRRASREQRRSTSAPLGVTPRVTGTGTTYNACNPGMNIGPTAQITAGFGGRSRVGSVGDGSLGKSPPNEPLSKLSFPKTLRSGSVTSSSGAPPTSPTNLTLSPMNKQVGGPAGDHGRASIGSFDYDDDDVDAPLCDDGLGENTQQSGKTITRADSGLPDLFTLSGRSSFRNSNNLVGNNNNLAGNNRYLVAASASPVHSQAQLGSSGTLRSSVTSSAGSTDAMDRDRPIAYKQKGDELLKKLSKSRFDSSSANFEQIQSNMQAGADGIEELLRYEESCHPMGFRPLLWWWNSFVITIIIYSVTFEIFQISFANSYVEFKPSNTLEEMAANELEKQQAVDERNIFATIRLYFDIVCILDVMLRFLISWYILYVEQLSVIYIGIQEGVLPLPDFPEVETQRERDLLQTEAIDEASTGNNKLSHIPLKILNKIGHDFSYFDAAKAIRVKRAICRWTFPQAVRRLLCLEKISEIFSVIPFYLFIDCYNFEGQKIEPNPLLFIRTMRVPRMLATFSSIIMGRAKNESEMRYFALIKDATVGVTILHLFTCFCYTFSRWWAFPDGTWVGRMDWLSPNGDLVVDGPPDDLVRYLKVFHSILEVIRTRTADVSAPNQKYEYFLSIFMSFLGIFGVAYVTSTLSTILFKMDDSKMAYAQKLKLLTSFGRRLRLPPHIQLDLRTIFENEASQNSDDQTDQKKKEESEFMLKEIFPKLSADQKAEIAIDMFNGKVMIFPFFKSRDVVFLWEVVPILQLRCYQRKAVVYGCGDRALGMCFVVSGQVNFSATCIWRKTVGDFAQENGSAISGSASDFCGSRATSGISNPQSSPQVLGDNQALLDTSLDHQMDEEEQCANGNARTSGNVCGLKTIEEERSEERSAMAIEQEHNAMEYEAEAQFHQYIASNFHGMYDEPHFHVPAPSNGVFHNGVHSPGFQYPMLQFSNACHSNLINPYCPRGQQSQVVVQPQQGMPQPQGMVHSHESRRFPTFQEPIAIHNPDACSQQLNHGGSYQSTPVFPDPAFHPWASHSARFARSGNLSYQNPSFYTSSFHNQRMSTVRSYLPTKTQQDKKGEADPDSNQEQNGGSSPGYKTWFDFQQAMQNRAPYTKSVKAMRHQRGVARKAHRDLVMEESDGFIFDERLGSSMAEDDDSSGEELRIRNTLIRRHVALGEGRFSETEKLLNSRSCTSDQTSSKIASSDDKPSTSSSDDQGIANKGTSDGSKGSVVRRKTATIKNLLDDDAEVVQVVDHSVPSNYLQDKQYKDGEHHAEQAPSEQASDTAVLISAQSAQKAVQNDVVVKSRDDKQVVDANTEEVAEKRSGAEVFDMASSGNSSRGSSRTSSPAADPASRKCLRKAMDGHDCWMHSKNDVLVFAMSSQVEDFDTKSDTNSESSWFGEPKRTSVKERVRKLEVSQSIREAEKEWRREMAAMKAVKLSAENFPKVEGIPVGKRWKDNVKANATSRSYFAGSGGTSGQRFVERGTASGNGARSRTRSPANKQEEANITLSEGSCCFDAQAYFSGGSPTCSDTETSSLDCKTYSTGRSVRWEAASDVKSSFVSFKTNMTNATSNTNNVSIGNTAALQSRLEGLAKANLASKSKKNARSKDSEKVRRALTGGSRKREHPGSPIGRGSEGGSGSQGGSRSPGSAGSFDRWKKRKAMRSPERCSPTGNNSPVITRESSPYRSLPSRSPSPTFSNLEVVFNLNMLDDGIRTIPEEFLEDKTENATFPIVYPSNHPDAEPIEFVSGLTHPETGGISSMKRPSDSADALYQLKRACLQGSPLEGTHRAAAEADSPDHSEGVKQVCSKENIDQQSKTPASIEEKADGSQKSDQKSGEALDGKTVSEAAQDLPPEAAAAKAAEYKNGESVEFLEGENGDGQDSGDGQNNRGPDGQDGENGKDSNDIILKKKKKKRVSPDQEVVVCKPRSHFGHVEILDASSRLSTATAKVDTELLFLARIDLYKIQALYPEAVEQLFDPQDDVFIQRGNKIISCAEEAPHTEIFMDENGVLVSKFKPTHPLYGRPGTCNGGAASGGASAGTASGVGRMGDDPEGLGVTQARGVIQALGTTHALGATQVLGSTGVADAEIFVMNGAARASRGLKSLPKGPLYEMPQVEFAEHPEAQCKTWNNGTQTCSWQTEAPCPFGGRSKIVFNGVLGDHGDHHTTGFYQPHYQPHPSSGITPLTQEETTQFGAPQPYEGTPNYTNPHFGGPHPHMGRYGKRG